MNNNIEKTTVIKSRSEPEIKESFLLRASKSTLKGALMIAGFVIASTIIFAVASSSGITLQNLQNTIKEASTSLTATRILLYVAIAWGLPATMFAKVTRNENTEMAEEAKKIKLIFRIILVSLFAIGEIFIVQNVIGKLNGA